MGGTIREREGRRYEISNVPALIRNQAQQLGTREPVLQRYERICFEKNLIAVQGKPLASFVCPGHPLLDATIDLVLQRYGDLLKAGAVLVDSDDAGEDVRALSFIEHAIQDARTDRAGNRQIVSRQMQFVEIDAHGTARPVGYAPYLDYRLLDDNERLLIEDLLQDEWHTRDLEQEAVNYAIAHLVPDHFVEVKQRKETLVAKTLAAVQEAH